MNEEFRKLRKVLDDDFRKKKHNKLRTLECALKYIGSLMQELDMLRTEAGEIPPCGDGPGPSGIGVYPQETEVRTRVDTKVHA